MSQHLLQNHARVQSDLLILVPSKRRKYDLMFPGEVFDSRPSRADLTAKEVVEYLYDVFTGFKLETSDIEDKLV